MSVIILCAMSVYVSYFTARVKSVLQNVCEGVILKDVCTMFYETCVNYFTARV